jgi:DNA polymerase III epsilon subunit-like protein
LAARHYSHWPRLVEIAGIECDEDGTIIKEFESIIKPDSFTIPKTASSVHGITIQIAQQNGRTTGVVLKHFCGSLENCSLLVGHNIGFDMNIISSEAFRVGKCFSSEFPPCVGMNRKPYLSDKPP